jgi:uncharacterized SAM-binding protein YcdF (DUF218 family)
MFFILSKVLAFLLFPLLYVFALLLVAVFSKKAKTRRKYLIIAVVILYIFSNGFLLNQFAKVWDVSPGKLENGKVYSAAIVLGGFAGDDSEGRGLFGPSADRFIQGVLLQKTGRVKDILISGGNGNLNPDGFREGAWAKLQLRDVQIPDSCVLIEDQSRNTLENASLTKKLLQQHGLRGPYLLVTSAYHMRRSLGIFRKTGIDVIPYPCNYIAGKKEVSFTELVPDADTLSKWSIYIKEVIGLVVNYISGRG